MLLGIASLAYPVFYYNYVPKKLIRVPIHLQYNAGLNPYGILSLSSDLMLEQAYDVSVDLTLPRSPANLERGNFMVALYAMKLSPINPALSFATPRDPYEFVTREDVVFASRRPALVPYEDPLVSRASKILFLLYHILFARTSETVTLSVPMGELVEFKGVLPLSLLVDVQAGQGLQVYSSTVTLVARLTGVRWLMYNHPIISWVVFTTIFWMAEMVSMGIAWLVLGQFFSGRGGGTGDAMVPKQEDREIYDRTRHGDGTDYERDGTVKNEDEDDIKIKEEISDFDSESELLDRSVRHPGDADDEGGSDEGAGMFGGTGFSLSSGKGGGGQVRRRISREEST